MYCNPVYFLPCVKDNENRVNSIIFVPMRKDYTVAGHTFSLISEDSGPALPDLSQYDAFAVPECSESPLFTLRVVDRLPSVDPRIVLDQDTEPGETKLRLFTCDDGWYCEASLTSSHPVAAKLLMSRDARSAQLEICSQEHALFAINNSLMLQYAFSTATLGTLEMHASVIAQGGKGYLFLAKSGTGKSTQSRMWLRAIEGSRLVNDDNPIVRLMPDGSLRVFGSPWSGKTPCYRNESYPVGAFVRIRRCSENRAVRLGVLEAYSSIYSSCSGFKADRAMGDGLHSTIEKAVSKTACFVLDCLPDEDAARVCYKAVKEADL